MTPRIQRLRAEIASDRAALEKHLDVLASLDLRADDPDGLARGALSLHHAYTVVETILARVARTVEGSLPEGPDWHKALLDDAALDIPTTRPALLAPTTVRHLHELRTFRHFVRHGYAFDLDAPRLADLKARTGLLRPGLLEDLARLDQWLAGVAEAMDD